jgi:hypothetical protein
MMELQESEKSAWVDVQFLKQAVEQVSLETLSVVLCSLPPLCVCLSLRSSNAVVCSSTLMCWDIS